VATFGGFDIYCFGMSLSENVHLILVIIIAVVLPLTILPEIERIFTSTLGGHRNWMRTRVLIVFSILFCVPLLVTFCVYRSFGFTHWAFVTILPALLVPIRVVAAATHHFVEEYDIRNDSAPWTDVDRVIAEIKASIKNCCQLEKNVLFESSRRRTISIAASGTV